MEKMTNQEQDVHINIKAAWVLKSMLGAYLVTGILLLALAFFMYQFHWDEGKLSIGIIVIYVVSNFIGGFIIGKCAKSRKFLWGLASGLLYFGILLLISLAFYRSLKGDGANAMLTLALCAGGGTLGGMLS